MFYLYTGTIEFAPLKSSGRENRDSYIKDHTADNRPKPCSPKSIYALADKVCSLIVLLVHTSHGLWYR